MVQDRAPRPRASRDEAVGRLSRIPPWVRALAILAVLYVFLCSIGLMGAGFKSMGKGFAQKLMEQTSNPLVGLFVGILATSIVQSSSLTTSIVVTMVSAGSLTVQGAIPIVMGANIGTSVTNTIVSLGFVTRRHEFHKAFACGTVHDFFNFLCVLILLPLELVGQRFFGMGYLERAASAVSGLFAATGSLKFKSPVKAVVKPVVKAVGDRVQSLFAEGATAAHWVEVGLALGMLFFCLWAITKIMKSLVLTRMESVIDRTVGKSALLAVTVGLLFTAIVQSSSITTSIMVPLAASGILTLEQVFPVTVGANLGTTVTALLASLSGSGAGLTIALVHLLFNVTGAIIFLPALALRQIPLRLAEGLADMTLRSRWYSVAYVGVIFFGIPALLVLFT
ncbi:Na/Pi symporter [bacterium]|nr:Na/Pi symporter [bacterium]